MTDKNLILLSHGSGGRKSAELVESLILARFNSKALRLLGDSAVVDMPGGHLAFTTDSYVVDPIFFPGGDIGDLAVNGTVNDLAVSGADPKFITLGLIIEEGLPVGDLERILDSVKRCSEKSGVEVVAGDTKVVPRGRADKIFINTSGIGIVPEGVELGMDKIQTGDAVLVSGTIGDHGVAVLSKRSGIGFNAEILSDTAPLNRIASALRGLGADLHFMRDPTRGGLAATLNESCRSGGFGIEIAESDIPVAPGVSAACSLLGLDPLHVANEGKLVAFVGSGSARKALEILHSFGEGRNAAIIGYASSAKPGRVISTTRSGGRRIVDMPSGEILPRIC